MTCHIEVIEKLYLKSIEQALRLLKLHGSPLELRFDLFKLTLLEKKETLSVAGA